MPSLPLCRGCRARPAWPIVLVVLFVAVAAGAYPVVRRLTRRLEALKRGVEQFGAGALGQRVDDLGRATRSRRSRRASTSRPRASRRWCARTSSLLANASHELRSPLARMKMAVSMLDEATPEQRDRLKREIDTNVAELDALVEEVLLASRLDAPRTADKREPVDLLALAAEEAARVGAQVERRAACIVAGDERLLRRALRNLLENARRYGGGEIERRARGAWRARRAPIARLRPRPRRAGGACASASSSRSSACPAMPSATAASASAWRSSSRSPSATAAACAARRATAAAAASSIDAAGRRARAPAPRPQRADARSQPQSARCKRDAGDREPERRLDQKPLAPCSQPAGDAERRRRRARSRRRGRRPRSRRT